MSTATKDIVHQSWLWKSPPAKVIFRPKRWSRRFFILKSGSYPNQFVLEYSHDESGRRSKRTINLDECEQICGPLNVHDRNHKYAFHLRTPSRTYYLAANSELEMNKWIEALCQVCGLKMMEDDKDGVVYGKPTNENTTPVVTTTAATTDPPESQHESDADSPTPSNKSPSGPYIPISECYTGKPLPNFHFSPNSNNEEVTYYNMSSFPFPPKVNWATHPYIRDGNDPHSHDGTGPKSTEISYAPPRPPKKTSSKPTTPTNLAAQSKPSPSPKSPEDAGHSAGVYENLEENPETSSLSSSIHSPPGSAGVGGGGGGLYCNIPDTSLTATNTENKTGAGASQNPQLSSSPSPSSTEANSVSAIPPKVDRNLKPEVKKANEINAAHNNHSSPASSNTSQCRPGCMTLPNKSSQNNFYGREGVSGTTHYPGPEIDRTRKPSDGHLTLSCTPAQKKSQSGMIQNNSKISSNLRMNTSTLPSNSSSRRRNGPVISPNDKKSPGFHHHHHHHHDKHSGTQELSGTYMQIEAIKESEARSQTLKSNNKRVGLPPAEPSVEYRVIDHVKTKALNQMRLDREKQLQTNIARH